MKILVLGGCGFIGSHLVEKFVKNGHDVRVFDRVNVNVDNIRSVMDKVDLRYGDFLDEWAVDEALDGCDVVYHLITTTFPGMTVKSGIYDAKSNLIPSIYLLETALRKGVKSFIFLSSGGTVYGNRGTSPIKETDETEPVTLYGLSKLSIENYIKLFCVNSDLKYTILRASNVYGPRQNMHGLQGLIAVSLGNVLYNKPHKIWGGGEIFRDYLYIDDLIDALYIAKEPGSGNRLLNVGSGKKYSVIEILNIIEGITGRKMPIIRRQEKKQVIFCNVLCFDKIQKEFGWHPKTMIEGGIKKTWEWAIRKHRERESLASSRYFKDCKGIGRK